MEVPKEADVVLYVLVVGFHHKKGCQLEYAYPPFPKLRTSPTTTTEASPGLIPLGENAELELPDAWKHLPSLGIPDGAHKYQSDTIYFHLPSLVDDSRTVFGISCYRQIDADKLLKKDSDVTRETVQKSVCVISRLPLYGIIEAKLALITHAYFEELDFSKVQLLEDTYNQLNESLNEKLLMESQIFVGLSVRDLVLRFKHRVLILFKLLLLEKRVLVYSSPVKLLSSSIISLISLFPEMVEHGLVESACHGPDIPEDHTGDATEPLSTPILDDKPQLSFVSEMDLLEEINSALTMTDDTATPLDFSKSHLAMNSESFDEPPTSDVGNSSPSDGQMPGDVASVVSESVTRQVKTFPVRPSLTKKDEYGFPLEVFTKGYICHPYLSLAYYDLVNDPSIPGFLVGATNQLFLHHHKKFADALVDVAEGKVEVYSPNLKLQLHLTKEDLRFADYVVKMVIDENSRDDVFHGTGWEGGEEWVRSQFRIYLMSMLGTSSHCSALDKNQKLVLDSYNYAFISAWRKTKNFRIWNENAPAKMDEFPIGHPCSGEYSVSDIKAKVNSMITPERVKKLSAAVNAVNETGKVLQQTTKSWGGTVSSWISGLRKET
ncbi:Late secretory pathway protein AVL9-like protein [Hypsibius exemplaris]|uniref:Late secretory pathway protein AVL9-like protein n=1 Tax=Hypsibius exemplaris TaxID=2072580 RepID=A0A9X6NIH2_HYPEX|nr:Late secretory pathway protein AVL9-like protein [Hypsibius exemplaris]